MQASMKNLWELSFDELESRIAKPGEDADLLSYFGAGTYSELKGKVLEFKGDRKKRRTASPNTA